MASLVIAEHNGNTLLPSTLSTITAAKAINSDIDILMLGYGIESIAVKASHIQGISTVFVADSPLFEHLLAENVEKQISYFLNSGKNHYQSILFPASSFGKNCAPRLAAKLDVSQISDITCVIDQHTFERPIYAGNAIATVHSDDEYKVITVRPTSFAAAVAEDEGKAPIEFTEVVLGSDQVKFISQHVNKSNRPDLQSARVVVSGGRGVGSAQAFKELVDNLADKLGAAVGASRAAVDAGYAPNDYQIGQTGKIVAPQLYIALGISGAIQHLAGMKESGVIVAINKDPDAPIFSIADYGLVADIFKAVPELIDKL
ncbi:electron transfer flavoprotein subunit alpha/FixB family protein [Salmonella enterica subsp. enterica serovar Hvittingfoss]|uniref:Electron transfer flavoprotein subunit alpha n=1 Tax=Salmonella enterica subsp. enterica serovar Isangi TaxID=1386015 RepID=A0A5W9RMW1_SALET|nr:FAD-binding protein [Salmonella enterica]EAA1474157.1 electron transfer flavoprotein subunit alpha [Salmonella enterica subsp. enterica serovar Hvittingfoss]EDS7304995.1 electron transfer flavoprotein subunit alpha/FixB family protein [Salmonella enterica subsp. enterica]EEL8155965.1 electron transfer flavoprotein subunit alpha/FixB family protein [Salmonella enterica subsp. enterica serovar Infantis]EAA5945869.1 electron transfer flavoprotein subunit alpha/FixB family protein [Salmonella en